MRAKDLGNIVLIAAQSCVCYPLTKPRRLLPKMPKPRQIKPWPDLVGILPLLKSAELLPRGSFAAVHVDMSNVQDLDVIGLAIFTAQLIQSTSLIHHELFFSNPSKPRVLQQLESLSFMRKLESLGFNVSPYRDLFTEFSGNSDFSTPSADAKDQSDLGKIIFVQPNQADSRATHLSRVKDEIKSFLRFDQSKSFAHEQVMVVLMELVKNTLDHSGCIAVLGLSLSLSKSGRCNFSFVYCDTGDGICHSVRRHMEKISEPALSKQNLSRAEVDDALKLSRLGKKGGFTDLIHWALQPGNTTKKNNGINLGLGLMLIVEASRNCGFRLTIKDADSMIAVSDLTSVESEDRQTFSHSLIRQLSVKTSSSPLLMFYGKLGEV